MCVLRQSQTQLGELFNYIVPFAYRTIIWICDFDCIRPDCNVRPYILAEQERDEARKVHLPSHERLQVFGVEHKTASDSKAGRLMKRKILFRDKWSFCRSGSRSAKMQPLIWDSKCVVKKIRYGVTANITAFQRERNFRGSSGFDSPCRNSFSDHSKFSLLPIFFKSSMLVEFTLQKIKVSYVDSFFFLSFFFFSSRHWQKATDNHPIWFEAHWRFSWTMC
jgi:hypothetical protein